MPWKDRYTISDEKSLLDSEVTWPDGHRCCFRIVVDLAPPCGPAGITPQDLTTPDAYFGMHGGLSGLRDVLRRRHLKATFAVPAVIADIHADTIRALREEGHEIAAHGFKHEDVSLLGRDEERVRLRRTTEILTRVAGVRPAGWFSLPRPSDKFAGGAVSGHTVDLLIEDGYDYFGNGLADDVPHYWGDGFRQPPRHPDAALLLSLRRSVLPAVPQEGHWPGEPRHVVPQLEGRARRAIQARPAVRHGAASARHRLAQPAAHAGAVF